MNPIDLCKSIWKTKSLILLKTRIMFASKKTANPKKPSASTTLIAKMEITASFTIQPKSAPTFQSAILVSNAASFIPTSSANSLSIALVKTAHINILKATNQEEETWRLL